MLVKGVADDKYALGYFGLAYYEENKETLKVAPVKDGENAPVTPSLTTVMDKSYSPLSRPIFIYVSSEAIKKAQVKSFVEFYLENAPEVSKTVGYIPMTEEEYKTQKDIFQSFCK
jgi:phosphate transport system substrate-binding protein